MSNQIIKVGLIGIGYWGKNLARNLHDLGVLTAICDLDSEIIKNSQNKYGKIKYYNNVDDFLNLDIDAVVISTPAATHGGLVMKALNRNKHVFVEKPLCLDVKEGIVLNNIAKEKNLKLMVGHLLLYHPAFIRMKEKIKSGLIGNIRYIYSNRLSLGKLRKEEDVLWSFAPHDISMILNLVKACLLYTSPSPRDGLLSRMPSSA